MQPKRLLFAVPLFDWLFGTDRARVRTTPEGSIAVVDVLREVGAEDPKREWTRIKRSHPDIAHLATPYRFQRGEKKVDAIPEAGIPRLLQVAKGRDAERWRHYTAPLLIQIIHEHPELLDDLPPALAAIFRFMLAPTPSKSAFPSPQPPPENEEDSGSGTMGYGRNDPDNNGPF